MNCLGHPVRNQMKTPKNSTKTSENLLYAVRLAAIVAIVTLFLFFLRTMY